MIAPGFSAEGDATQGIRARGSLSRTAPPREMEKPLPYPYHGRSPRPKRARLANQPADARPVSELRIPAVSPMFCRHRHVFNNCRICTSEREAMLGYTAPRL
jgi:hypothetical protein